MNTKNARSPIMAILGLAIIAFLAVIAFALFIQIIPYGRSHTNPPVVTEPNWDNLQTRALAKRACYDCHSNETTWPWYSNVAPVSWLVQHDVDEGRQRLNFSEWGTVRSDRVREGRDLDEMGEVILEGEMPPAQYLITHPEAHLTETEKHALADGLAATLSQ